MKEKDKEKEQDKDKDKDKDKDSITSTKLMGTVCSTNDTAIQESQWCT